MSNVQANQLAKIEDPKDKLLPILNALQEKKGYISQEGLKDAARQAGVPLSIAYGVAKFFQDFDLSPQGKYKIQVCDGTACHVKRSMKILDRIVREMGIEEGETTDDKIFTLSTVRCLGCCSLAPVMKIGDEIYGNLTPDRAMEIIDEIRKGETDERD